MEKPRQLRTAEKLIKSIESTYHHEVNPLNKFRFKHLQGIFVGSFSEWWTQRGLKRNVTMRSWLTYRSWCTQTINWEPKQNSSTSSNSCLYSWYFCHSKIAIYTSTDVGAFWHLIITTLGVPPRSKTAVFLTLFKKLLTYPPTLALCCNFFVMDFWKSA